MLRDAKKETPYGISFFFTVLLRFCFGTEPRCLFRSLFFFLVFRFLRMMDLNADLSNPVFVHLFYF